MNGIQKNNALNRANQALREGHILSAVQAYIALLQQVHPLSRSIVGNLAIARNRFIKQRSVSERLKVGVCSLMLNQAAAYRVHLLTQLYQEFADTELLDIHVASSRAKKSASHIDSAIPRRDIVAEQGGSFINHALEQVAKHPYDLVHLSEPHAGNILIGLLYKLLWGAQVLVDMDDEAGALNDEPSVSLQDDLAEKSSLSLLGDVSGADWSPTAVALANAFDGLTVSTIDLQHRHGGALIPRATNEEILSPSAYLTANRPKLLHTIAKGATPGLSTPLQILLDALGHPVLRTLASAPNAGVQDYCTRLSIAPISPRIPEKIAIVTHVYYEELWPDIASRLQRIHCPFQLFVTTTDDRLERIRQTVTADFPQARFAAGPNQGMDVLPFLRLLPILQQEDYRAVCKVHTKKGEGEGGRHWREAMLDALIGSQAAVTDVIDGFARHADLALVGPASHYQSARRLMLGNQAMLNDLLSLVNRPKSTEQDWGFFAGTMFWARPQLFEPLMPHLEALAAQADSTYAPDGQFSHAMERLFGALATTQGANAVGLLHVARRPDSPARPSESPIIPRWDTSTATAAASTHQATREEPRYVLQRVTDRSIPGQSRMRELAHQFITLEEDRARIIRSGLFDLQHYRAQAPELTSLAIDLPTHYLLMGRFRGLSPHRHFDPALYARQHAQYLQPGEDPFSHYLQKGAAEGLLLRATKEQEATDIPSFRYRVLNSLLIDWSRLAAEQRNPDLVSVIIEVHDDPELTKACLDSVSVYTAGAKVEIIAVDNGNAAPTQTLLAEYEKRLSRLQVIRQQENLNVALSYNLGFAASRGQTVVFLKSQTTVTKGWLAPLVEALKRPEISAAQPLVLDPNGAIQSMGMVFAEKNLFGYPIYAGQQPEPDWTGRSRSFHAVTGACMAVRATDFAAAKGFDPLYINGQEDIDLSLRLNQHSHHLCWYTADSTVYHAEGKSAESRRYTSFNRREFSKRWRQTVQADDHGHYTEDDFVILAYQPVEDDCSEREYRDWRPRLKNIRHVTLERPDNLEPYFFDKIKSSGLFNARWYFHQYNKQFDLSGNLLAHYLKHSVAEGLNPSAKFDTLYYLRTNSDLKAADLHPFIHYVAQGCHEGRSPLPPPPAEYTTQYQVAEPEYIPRLPRDAEPIEKAVRVIAFYLPQFHPIPENDEWWGKGFTEWTNVKPAEPQFDGHYQPHVPDDFLGYYDLLDGETQYKQIALAKQYGIEGFCFYLYWFNGHRLLEKPVDNYLNDPTLDLPFCVCWANENWTRRWDGLDQDILMEQQYSAEDDLAVISEVSRYLDDPRYIRVNQKPLLLIYRPNLFPDMRQTVDRWRTWCREKDIGEIYLAYPQSFECVNPAEYGFDAAIEFPPNNSNIPNVTHRLEGKKSCFDGRIYDWRRLLERSDQYADHGYVLYRSVNPGWDNTARKKNKGNVLHNSCPRLFERWLNNAYLETLTTPNIEQDDLVFVNAWNEWAEGAHLEPDKRYGYAWLQSIRRAHVTTTEALRVKIALVIHAFYPEILPEILERISWIQKSRIKIFASTTEEKYTEVYNFIKDKNYDFEVIKCVNRGRDILPFLQILPKILALSFDLVLKVHTKKSTHRVDGDKWRQELYDILLSRAFINNACLRLVESQESFGMMAPAQHIVPLSFYWGSNKQNVFEICKRGSVEIGHVDDEMFVAGTMFIANRTLLLPIQELGLKEADFEEEHGQVDGTYAHALERYFGILCRAKNLSIVPYGQVGSGDYPYAKKG